jgi:hypothetical protein
MWLTNDPCGINSAAANSQSTDLIIDLWIMQMAFYVGMWLQMIPAGSIW